MKYLLLFTSLISSTLSCFSQEKDLYPRSRAEDLIGTWAIISQRLDNLEITLTDCEKQSHFIFTAKEIIENYYKIYDGRCVILNSNKDMYTIKENHIVRKEESDLNNTFAIENDLLTLTFTGKDEDGTEHIAVIILKKTKPIEYIK
ncbi:lipocalin family protein [Capnocytophaga leadbetteri]